jgi:serine/threonine protein kinase
MPPEAFSGEAPGPWFDLWACAVVMAEALTGEYPFGAVAPAIDRLSAGAVPDLVPAVERLPRPVVDFLREALHVDRRRRPATAEEFLSNLES